MLGRVLLSISALAQIIGPFAADYSVTHVLNPNWPPHAKFHNGQTMSMGLCLGLLTLYFTHRPGDAEQKKDSLRSAAMIGSLYWITGLSAILYPGSLAIDPEFGEGFPQFWVFVGFGIAAWTGWWIETRGIGREKSA